MTLAACGRDRDVYRCGIGVCDSRADGDADRPTRCMLRPGSAGVRTGPAQQQAEQQRRYRSVQPNRSRLRRPAATAARQRQHRTEHGQQSHEDADKSPRRGAGAASAAPGRRALARRRTGSKRSSAPTPTGGPGRGRRQRGGSWTTCRPYLCACRTQSAVPRPPGNANKTALPAAAAAAHISALRRGPALRP